MTARGPTAEAQTTATKSQLTLLRHPERSEVSSDLQEDRSLTAAVFFFHPPKHKRLSNPHENQERKNPQQQGNGAGVSCAFFLFLEQIAV